MLKLNEEGHMADIQIGVGEEWFEDLRKNHCYYADKTEMIYKMVNDKKTKVTLFTRPRRFGKSLTMSMLQSFFDITRDSRGIFDGLSVTKHESFCKEWMNQYPVLLLTFKDVTGLNFEEAYGMLVSCIADLCKEHSYLADSDNVNSSDKKIFQKLCDEDANAIQIKKSLLILSRMMHAHYQRPVILLMDEYDVPLAKAHESDKESKAYYPKMLELIGGLMNSALKTNRFLKFSVITGCLRIVKESIFTGVNNFKTYGLLDLDFCDAFGFTELEVKELLKACNMSDKQDLVKSWYDGYIFGDSEMFCPWDVLNFVDDHKRHPELEPYNYWKNTSGNDIVDEFVDDPKFQVSSKFEALMNGGVIEQTITDQLTYGELKDNENNLWSVLFMAGYLTKSNRAETGSTVHLKIPNAEISSIFEDAVVRHFNNTIDKNVQKEILNALWDRQEDKVTKLITDLLWDTISYHNYHENYYHAFVTGMLVGQGYEVESDQENGLGRTDIVIRDRKNRRAIIIEAKKAEKEDDMVKMCKEGKEQIIKKKYVKGLRGYNEIICYGLSFFEKTAFAMLLDVEE